MPLQVVTGPPFAGKSQAVARVRRAGEPLIDTTYLWKALYSPESGAIRTMEQARVAQAAKMAALKNATAQGLDGWVTVAERDPIQLKRWLDAAGQQKAWLVTEPMETLIRRARAAGPECEELLTGWDDYEDDPDFMALTERWSEEEMRTIHDVETQYRAALEGLTVREAGSDVQHRCLTDNAELRAAGGSSRVVTGVAVRYGDEARIEGGIRERIAKGALELPTESANLTLQHDRAMPLGLIRWQDDEDALRFSADLTPGPRQDQALLDVRNGLFRGASIELKRQQDRIVEMDSENGPLVEIMKGKIVRVSLVDDGAYPQSAISLRFDPMKAAPPVVSAPSSRPRRMMVV